MTHANFTNIVRVILGEENLVVSPGTDVTTPSGMLPMFSNTTVTHRNMSPTLTSLTETGDHFWYKKRINEELVTKGIIIGKDIKGNVMIFRINKGDINDFRK